MEIDPATDAITVTYALRPGSSATPQWVGQSAISAATPLMPTAIHRTQVTVRHDQTLAAEALAIKGGHFLRERDSLTLGCTSGFTIRVGDTTNGVATAMHCSNALVYEHQIGVITYENAASLTPGGNRIDLQWHSTIPGNSTTTEFQADYGEHRTVVRASNRDVGDEVCHFGVTTEYKQCTHVHSLGNCVTCTTSGRFCGLTATETPVGAHGNSGGPFFQGTEADGFHSGRYSMNGVYRALYTPQSWVANLNGRIRT